MSTLDQEYLNMLTDEERAAIADDDGMTDEDLDTVKALAGEDDTDDTDDSDDSDDDDGDDDAGTPDDVDAEPDAELAVDDPQPKQFTPRYEAQLPSDFEDQVKALADQERELKAQFKDGDIDFDEYEEQRDTILTQREALTISRAKAEIATEMQAQTAAQQWQANIDSFLTNSAKQEGGIDYRNDEAMANDLDQFVKVLAKMESNNDKPMEWFLTEADKRVKALHGMAVPAKRETVADAADKRKANVSGVPKSLAQVPGGSGPGDVDGEFSSMDALYGDDLEAAIAKMTPAQRERYSQA